MQTQSIKLVGLTCPACKKVTEKRIGGIAGVDKVEVNVALGIAMIDSEKEISVATIQNVLQDTPYQVIESTTL